MNAMMGLRMNAKVNTMVHTMIGDVARWFAHGSANAVLPMQRTSLRQMPTVKSQVAPNLEASYAHIARPGVRFDANIARVPKLGLQQLRGPQVRVIQVREPGQARASVGRMVMSGRMADVCAELDRLVAREAALH